MSSDLTWLLVRNWNSFQVKGGHGPVFSKEKGNLLNKSAHKYSGLANSKVVSIHPSADGGITITKIKADAKPNQVVSARSHVALKRSTGPRRANKIAAAETAGKGYRADLRAVAVARTSALLRAERRTANPPKSLPDRSPRGKKAAAAAQVKEESE
ncbi:60s ribosomal protein, putative [Cryptococcus gattii WM276]|uniref:60s ribosomal protein, putative n=1 Tax=Cryptococcus gattii serotype B (strain WM276 / ATCC MYA-4071) TaxID=367775 RepID=E6QYY3_CRYGW|nr:60s ribosomal protein, putative [Cryptococcus gattii WM276]ADV19313.1 60s ribosomal protein, putative [Cryptococcus gattii WM276]